MWMWLESDGVRVAGYLTVAVAALVMGLYEQGRSRARPDLWPTFWYLTAILFLAMGLARAGNIVEFAVDLSRQEAISSGWYDRRRKYQAMVVGAVAAAWFIGVIIAIWRVPERRRRYLPMVVWSVTIVCYAGIRSVSLHQIDSVLYRKYVHGVEVAGVLEMALLAVAVVLVFWHPRRRARTAALDGDDQILRPSAGGSRG